MKLRCIILLMTAVLVLMLSGCRTRETAVERISGTLNVYCFDAGKADAHLLYGDGWAVLIDCGEKGFGKEILGTMETLGIRRIDKLIITHFDKDHVGGAAKVIKSAEVGEVYQSNSPKDSKEYDNYVEALSEKGIVPQTVRSRTDIKIGGIDITIDPPLYDSYDKDPSNNSSLITEVRCGSCSMLFAGDAQDARLQEYTAAGHGSFDLLKVPYHGHYQKQLIPFLESVSAKWAVITSSDREPEDERTMRALKKAGGEVFLTRRAPVVITCDGENIAVSYAKND